MIDIANLQRKFEIDVEAIRRFVGQATTAVIEARGKQVSVAFVSDRRMKELNKVFRNKNATTDVLSFPYEKEGFEPESSFIGDIVISAEQANRQAQENGLTLETEIKQLILHGLLHICGFNHEADNGEMDRRELGLRSELKIVD